MQILKDGFNYTSWIKRVLKNGRRLRRERFYLHRKGNQTLLGQVLRDLLSLTQQG